MKPLNQSEQNRIFKAYDRFVPHRLMELTGKTDITTVALGDHIEKKMTVLFSDIRDFTTFSEKLTPEENFNFLNSYLHQVAPVFEKFNGIIDKYIGDAVMGLFDGPVDEAIDGALALLVWLKEYNRGRKRAGYEKLSIGIGLNTGILMLGTIGGLSRMDYTVIGDSVNIASRIEGLTKEFCVPLIISEHTLRSLRNPAKYAIRFLDRLSLRGSHYPISVFEVFDGDAKSLRTLKKKWLHLFEDAVAHYHYRKIWKAEQLFRKYLAIIPDDIPAKIYLKRCGQFRRYGTHAAAEELTVRIRWRSDYRTGIASIDNQHYHLFSHASRLIKAVSEGYRSYSVGEHLQFLKDYARIHFSDEESFLEEIGYPHLQNQQSQHDYFLRDLTLIEKQLGSAPDTGSCYALFRVQVLIINWIIHHIVTEDQHYALFYSKLGR